MSSNLTANKIFFCLLATGLVAIGLNEASHAFFHKGEAHEEKAEGKEAEAASINCAVFKDMCVIPTAGEAAAGGAAGDEAPKPIDWAVAIPAANIEAGKEVAVKCQQCHKFEKGAEPLQGPPLYGVLGRDAASYPGFKYSDGPDGLTSVEGVWDYEHLNAFLTRPKGYKSATAMNFVGLKKEADRINLIAYLRSNEDTPFPLPPPLPPQAAAGAAPAEGATPAAATGETPLPEGAAPASSPSPVAPTSPAPSGANPAPTTGSQPLAPSQPGKPAPAQPAQAAPAGGASATPAQAAPAAPAKPATAPAQGAAAPATPAPAKPQ